jgi:hypothetical protein
LDVLVARKRLQILVVQKSSLVYGDNPRRHKCPRNPMARLADLVCAMEMLRKYSPLLTR